MSREVVHCVDCRQVHLQVPRSEFAQDEREQYELCNRCGSKNGFVQGSLTDDEAVLALPVCIPLESPREVGMAIGLYEFSDAEVMRRIRKQGGTR